MRIEDFIIMVFCLVDDALQKIIGSEPLRKRGFPPSLSDSEVIVPAKTNITLVLKGWCLSINLDSLSISLPQLQILMKDNQCVN